MLINLRAVLCSLLALSCLPGVSRAGDFDFDIAAALAKSPPVGTVIGQDNVEMSWYYRDMRSQKVERVLEFEAAAMRFMYRHVIDPIPQLKDNGYKVYNAVPLTALDPGEVASTKFMIFYNSDDRAEEQGWSMCRYCVACAVSRPPCAPIPCSAATS